MERATRKLPKHLQLKIKRGISNLVFDAEEEENEYVVVLEQNLT